MGDYGSVSLHALMAQTIVRQPDEHRPEPPSLPGIPASDTDFGPPDGSGVNPSDDPISQSCEVLAAVLDWVFKSLEKAAQLLYDIVKNILSAVTMVRISGANIPVFMDYKR